MTKLFKKILIPFLAISVISINTLSAQAANTNTTDNSDISVINTIAKNTPQYLLGSDPNELVNWSSVTVVNSKALYDFNDKLIAYSVDLKSNINNEKAYAIISTSDEDGPILQFAEGTDSPFDSIPDNQISIYEGVSSYYSHDLASGNYYDLKDNKNLNDAVIQSYKNLAKKHKYISAQPNAKQIRSNLSLNVAKTKVATMSVLSSTPPNLTYQHLLSGVPDYAWYLGCYPTAAAMVIKHNFSSNSKIASANQNTLISKLATACKTESDGTTPYSYYGPSGIKSVVTSYGSSCTSNNIYGATFQQLINSIEANQAVVVTVSANPTYGNHSMAGLGYAMDTSNTHFVILHVDPSLPMGNVYCNYDSSTFSPNGTNNRASLTTAY